MTFPVHLADLNLAESLREFTRWSAEAEFVEHDGLLLTAGADGFPAINDVMRCGAGAEPHAERLFERAQAFFAARKRGFGIRTRAHCDADLIAACQARGLFFVGESPGMAALAPVPASKLPALKGQVELRVASDAQSAGDFARVASASYATQGLPPPSAAKLFGRVERALQPHVHIVVAYDADLPVCTALAFLSHGIGGVYWVGTTPSARRRNIAPHCTQAVTNWCFERGASAVILQASKQGEPIYRALGFEEFTRYPWFLSLPARDGAVRT
jgi:GNAT superfamily N-acetyltransferase